MGRPSLPLRFAAAVALVAGTAVPPFIAMVIISACGSPTVPPEEVCDGSGASAPPSPDASTDPCAYVGPELPDADAGNADIMVARGDASDASADSNDASSDADSNDGAVVDSSDAPDG